MERKRIYTNVEPGGAMKEKKIAVRFVQKQLEIAQKRLGEMKNWRCEMQEKPGVNLAYMDGRITGKMSEIETLTHLIENCSE